VRIAEEESAGATSSGEMEEHRVEMQGLPFARVFRGLGIEWGRSPE
jgi:hypothetical protein